MKISQEASDRNREIINNLLAKWKLLENDTQATQEPPVDPLTDNEGDDEPCEA